MLIGLIGEVAMTGGIDETLLYFGISGKQDNEVWANIRCVRYELK